jgi:hypothetical protein
MIFVQANSFGKAGRLCKDLSDTGIISCYVAIKDILRARADDFVDLTESNEVGFIDMLQNLSQDIDWDRRHDGGYGASLCPLGVKRLTLGNCRVCYLHVLVWKSLDMGIVY